MTGVLGSSRDVGRRIAEAGRRQKAIVCPTIAAWLFAGVLAFTGCARQKKVVEQRCVGQENQVVDDWYCEDNPPSCSWCVYHWVYGGNRTGYVPPGTVIVGGATSAPADAEFARATSAPRYGGDAPVVTTPDARTSSAGKFAVPTSDGFTARGVFGAAGEAAGEAGHGAGE